MVWSTTYLFLQRHIFLRILPLYSYTHVPDYAIHPISILHRPYRSHRIDLVSCYSLQYFFISHFICPFYFLYSELFPHFKRSPNITYLISFLTFICFSFKTAQCSKLNNTFNNLLPCPISLTYLLIDNSFYWMSHLLSISNVLCALSIIWYDKLPKYLYHFATCTGVCPLNPYTHSSSVSTYIHNFWFLYINFHSISYSLPIPHILLTIFCNSSSEPTYIAWSSA